MDMSPTRRACITYTVPCTKYKDPPCRARANIHTVLDLRAKNMFIVSIETMG